jgi:hypothetical protein
MASTIKPTWLPEFTLVSAQAITTGNTFTSDEVDNTAALGTEIKIKIAYGNPASVGVKVHLLRCFEEGGEPPVYEAIEDNNFVREMAYGTSATKYYVFTVPQTVSKFKIGLSNASGATVTADIMYKQIDNFTIEVAA